MDQYQLIKRFFLPCGLACLVLSAVVASSTYAQGLPEPIAPGSVPEPKINEEEYAKDSTTEINVKNADIAAIIRIFSRKTKRNYILDEKVKGKISIYLPGKVSAEESLRILDAVLSMKGFTSVPIGENLWKIVPSKEAKQSTIPTLTESSSENPSAAVVTRIVTLKYVAADEIQQMLAQLISTDGLIQAYTGTNSLILIDSEDNIERLVKLVEELDVPYTDREMTIIPIKFAEAKDVADKVNTILLGAESKQSSAATRLAELAGFGGGLPFGGAPAGQPGAPASLGRASAGGRPGSARGREPKIIPDERTNSLIIVADQEMTSRVRALVTQLDSKVDLSGGKFYVYRCQHANAEELSQILAGLAGTGGASGSSRTGAGGTSGGGGGLFGGSSGGSSGSSGFGSSSSSLGGGGQNSLFGGSGGSSGGSGNSLFGSGGSSGGGAAGGRRNSGPSTAQLGPNISITADPATNSLVIAASKADYEKIKVLIDKLDVKRRQVLVEAVLLEVSIDRTTNISTNFMTSTGGADGGVLAQSNFGGSSRNLTTLFTSPGSLQGFSLAAASAGVLKLPNGTSVPTQSALVNLAQSNNNTNVLSSPTILATDNETAQIVVGQNVPFLASTSTNQTNLNNTFNQINRQDVGITLRLTPQISSQDYVTLKIFTEVSALDRSTLNSQFGPTTSKRQSENTVISKDSQMIVIGGLISDEQGQTDEGIPWLKDIPVLGHVFRSSSEAQGRKNLLIFITPRIVRDQFDMRDATIERRDTLEDVIQSYGVQPERQEVLTNRHIDNVAESSPYVGPKPGTILPPAKVGRVSVPPSGKAVDAEASDPSTVTDGSSDGTLDLRVSQATGRKPMGIPSEVVEVNGSRSSLNPSVLSQVANNSPFLVFRFVNKKDQKGEYPFLVDADSEMFGIILPPDSSSEKKAFFEIGAPYSYKLNNRDVPVELIGLFTSEVEAKEFYPQLSPSWHTLTPHEIINLGKSPWVKRK